MLRRIALSALAVFVLFSTRAFSANISLSTLSFGGGVAWNGHQNDLFRATVLPEIQADGNFLTSWLNWGVSYAYRNDSNPIPDDSNMALSYNYTPPVGTRGGAYSLFGHILGTRLTLLPGRNPRNPATFGFFAGYSRHFLRERFLRKAETGWSGDSGKGPGFTTFDLGVSVILKIRGPFALRGEMRLLRPLGERNYPYDSRGTRFFTTVGVAYCR